MRFRSDKCEPQADGSTAWFAEWMGGPTLSKVRNCRLNLAGDMRRTVTITGHADTFFSIPAECSIAGRVVRGYITTDEQGYIFHHVYY